MNCLKLLILQECCSKQFRWLGWLGYTGWSPDTLSSFGSPCGEISKWPPIQVMYSQVVKWFEVLFGEVEDPQDLFVWEGIFFPKELPNSQPTPPGQSNEHRNWTPRCKIFWSPGEERIPQSDWVPWKGEVIADLCVEGTWRNNKKSDDWWEIPCNAKLKSMKADQKNMLSFMDIHLGACKTQQRRRELWSGCRNFAQDFLRKGRPWVIPLPR